MTTDQQIARFITNLDDDQYIGFRVFDKLCDHYNWQGAVFGELDIRHIFLEASGKDITESQLEELHEMINLYDILSEVAISHITRVVSYYLNQQEDEDE